jgi:indole-3-glycerol phosphate synthase/phosphoribosylanthranilate isomerase
MGALERIVARRRADLDARADYPDLSGALSPSTRSLASALARPGARVIMECKKASPSRGELRPDYDAGQLAAAYDGIADAVSVLTEAPHFGGRLSDLSRARARNRAPILCKDFIVAPEQLRRARAHGADAALLMLSVLDDAAYRDLARVARGLSLDVLTEVHDADEMARAARLGARVIGINNRDLRTLTVDLATTEALAPLAPPDALLVSESGVSSRDDIARLAPLVDGFLVGSALTSSPDARLAARELVHGRVKVCGLTRPEDARLASDLGARHGGLIFAPESPRFVTRARARALVDAAPALEWVGVYVNAPTGRIAADAESLGLRVVQLHGDEDAAYVARLRGALPDSVAIWRAHRVRDGRVPEGADAGADRLLLDAYRPGARGGTGRRFDWRALDALPNRHDVVLSGGLSPENATDAASKRPHCLDVNSGVESAPGVKSHALLRALFDALRPASRTTPRSLT